MPAIWTTPRDWTAGELITEAIADAQWRDNLMYLKDSPTFDGSPTVTGTLTLSGALVGNNATDSTSTLTGAIQTDGGLGVVKALWVGGLANIAGAVTLQTTLAVTGTLNVTGITTLGTVNITTLSVGTLLTLTDLTVTGTTLLSGASITLGDNAADTVTITGTVVGAPLKTYTETRTTATIGGGALALDCAVGTYFTVALNANATVSFANVPASGRVVGLTVIFTADGTLRTLTWPAAVKWQGAVAPTMTSTVSKRDVISLVTEDGGTTWFGIVVGQNY